MDTTFDIIQLQIARKLFLQNSFIFGHTTQKYLVYQGYSYNFSNHRVTMEIVAQHDNISLGAPLIQPGVQTKHTTA